MDNRLALIILRGKIRGLMAACNRSRRLIRKSTGQKRNGHWQTKRAVGTEARWHMLAAAYLRGTPYRHSERSTDPLQNPVSVQRIAEILVSHTPWSFGYDDRKLERAKEKVKQWLDAHEQRPQPAPAPSESAARPEPPRKGPIQRAIALLTGRQP